jgi:pentatricopeptide repeat protein
MYIRCGDLPWATDVFYQLVERNGCNNINIWNMMISMYITSNKPEKAEELYWQLKQTKTIPDSITLTSLLTMCADTGNLTLGREIQKDIETYMVECTVQLDTALLTMLAKTNCIEEAECHFNDMKRRRNANTASWNALLSGYVQNDMLDQAVMLYQQMQREHIVPSERTFSIMLTAVSQQANLSLGKELHAQIVSMRFPYNNHISSALITMYSNW